MALKMLNDLSPTVLTLLLPFVCLVGAGRPTFSLLLKQAKMAYTRVLALHSVVVSIYHCVDDLIFVIKGSTQVSLDWGKPEQNFSYNNILCSHSPSTHPILFLKISPLLNRLIGLFALHTHAQNRRMGTGKDALLYVSLTSLSSWTETVLVHANLLMTASSESNEIHEWIIWSRMDFHLWSTWHFRHE